MSHFAILAPEMAGHLFPLGALGCELRRRGHQVTLVARAKAAAIARQLELPLSEVPVDDVPWKPTVTPGMFAARLVGLEVVFRARTRLCREAELLLSKAPQIVRDLDVDGVLVDQDVIAGGTVAEHLGLPFVTVCSALMWHEEAGVPPHFTGWSPGTGRWARVRNRTGYAAWQAHLRRPLHVINGYRAAWQLRPLRRFGDTHSPYAQIVQLCPELDFPRRELASTCHYVGSLTASRPCDDAFPWDRLDDRPLIFASLGTMPGGDRNLTAFRKIAAACAGLDAQLVIALGKWTEQSGNPRDRLCDLPGDPVVVDFAPQLALLKKAAVMITHAGLNTALETLAHGVPMIALPRFADQPGVAARLERAGAALRASYRHFTPEELRRLLERLLAEQSFQERARPLQRALVAAGGVRRAADIVEQALNTARPVIRGAEAQVYGAYG